MIKKKLLSSRKCNNLTFPSSFIFHIYFISIQIFLFQFYLLYQIYINSLEILFPKFPIWCHLHQIATCSADLHYSIGPINYVVCRAVKQGSYKVEIYERKITYLLPWKRENKLIINLKCCTKERSAQIVKCDVTLWSTYFNLADLFPLNIGAGFKCRLLAFDLKKGKWSKSHIGYNSSLTSSSEYPLKNETEVTWGIIFKLWGLHSLLSKIVLVMATRWHEQSSIIK